VEDPRPALQTALKEAMKNKDTARRNTIRMMQSAIKQVEIDSQKELDATGVVAILQKEAKKRRESIGELENAGRADQAADEQQELEVIESFLPRQLTEEEVVVIVREVIAEVGAETPKDTGKVMGPVMAKVKGLADGNLVSKVVREQLS